MPNEARGEMGARSPDPMKGFLPDTTGPPHRGSVTTPSMPPSDPDLEHLSVSQASTLLFVKAP